MRGLCLPLALVVGIACSATSPAENAPPIANGRPEAARWFADSFLAQPVAGYKAALGFEYVPSAQASDPRPTLNGTVTADSEIALTARCVGCTAPVLNSVATRYEVRGPEDVAHVGATAAFGATLTFPAPGVWQLDPFGNTIEVRAISAFEPPLVHLRPYSAPLPAECGREQVAELMKRFENAYNTGDAELLAGVGQSAFDFSIAGGAVPVIVQGRDAFVSAAVARQAIGERIEFTLAYVAADKGRLGVAFEAIRTAPDLPAGRQMLSGKSSMWCEQPQSQFIHLNLGARP